MEMIRNIPEVINNVSAPGMTDTFWGWEFVNEVCSHSPLLMNLQHFCHTEVVPFSVSLVPAYSKSTLGHESFCLLLG